MSFIQFIGTPEGAWLFAILCGLCAFGAFGEKIAGWIIERRRNRERYL